MSPTIMWIIILAIGLVIGFIVHAAMRYAQGASLLITLVAGIIGAFIAAFYIAPYLPMNFIIAARYIWAVIGSFVLSLIAELLFVGSTRGRVVTT